LEDLSQHILDISFNSLEAGCTRLEICIREDLENNVLEFTVRDNGRGIDREDMQRVTDPFYTTKKNARVGLGISLLREAVERCDGTFEIESKPREGTVVKASFVRDHVDRAPLGDIAGALVSLIAGNSGVELFYSHRFNQKEFNFSTGEMRAALKGYSMQTPAVLVWLEEYLRREITELRRIKDEKFGRAG